MQAAGPIIRTEFLTKSYGKERGIEDVNLEVRRGEVFGYLGPNGAGKTTTIRTLLDLLRPTRGSVRIFGLDCRRNGVEIRRRIGYLSGELQFYGNLTGQELLRHVGSLRGMEDFSYAFELAGRLECDLTRRFRTLSHGNRHKVGLILAFMHRPELVILDEPTTGLDPLIQQQFYRLVIEARDAGATVFLSSHILPEVERVCDRVGIIRQGRLVTVEPMETLKSRALRRLEVHFACAAERAHFAGIPGVRDLAVEGNILRCNVVGSLNALVKAVSQFEVANIISHEPSLEEVFLTFYHGDIEDAQERIP